MREVRIHCSGAFTLRSNVERSVLWQFRQNVYNLKQCTLQHVQNRYTRSRYTTPTPGSSVHNARPYTLDYNIVEYTQLVYTQPSNQYCKLSARTQAHTIHRCTLEPHILENRKSSGLVYLAQTYAIHLIILRYPCTTYTIPSNRLVFITVMHSSLFGPRPASGLVALAHAQASRHCWVCGLWPSPVLWPTVRTSLEPSLQASQRLVPNTLPFRLDSTSAAVKRVEDIFFYQNGHFSSSDG